jgi:hypothetical protein
MREAIVTSFDFHTGKKRLLSAIERTKRHRQSLQKAQSEVKVPLKEPRESVRDAVIKLRVM